MDCASPVCNRLADLARQLRTGFFTEACVGLPAAMEPLAGQLAASPVSRQQAFALQLNDALRDWQRCDWLSLADTREYDLPAALDLPVTATG